jgi:hypothetical protein
MRVLLAASLLLVSCMGTTHIDYIDFVKANGIDYIASGDGRGVGRALGDADLGPEQWRVKHMLSGETKGLDYRTADGDSAFVPVGEPVFAVKGYATTFRLAARRNGRIVLYEADTNPAAKTGRDLLDIEGKVRAIALISDRTPTAVVGRIVDVTRVRELVGAVLSAPVDQKLRPSAGYPPGGSASVAFELADGTAIARGYDVTNGILHRGILVGDPFRAAIQALVAAAPTPTPVPAVVNLTKRYDLALATRVTIKGPPTPMVQDGALVTRFAAALDTYLPATRSTDRAVDGPVVIFEFPDHYVSLVYERGSDLLRVAVPNDEFSVRTNAEFRALLDAAR